MKKKTLIFTATYNESGNIEKYLSAILKNKNIDLLIIDDSSPDGTFSLIKRYKKKYKNLFLIIRKKKLGLDTAHKLAFKIAKKKNYDNLITMDADLSHDPNKIKYFISALKKHPFVIGSRYIDGGQNRMKFGRFILSYLGNKFIKFVLNINCNEYTTSYRGFNLLELKNFDIKIVNSKGYSFFMETIFWINKYGYQIKELPIIFYDRDKGKSKISKIESFRTLKNLLLLKLKKFNKL